MAKLSPSRLAYERKLAKRFTSGGVLIFLHIPKCAGKTINLVMQRESHKQKIRCKGYIAQQMDVEDGFADVDALRGHLFYGIHKWLRRPHVYFTLLRDPVARVISLYYWMKRYKKMWSCPKLGLCDWIERKESLPYVSNVMTKLIAGTHSGHDGLGVFKGNHGIDSTDLLVAAKEHLREEFIFDIVFRFNRGYDRFCDLFGWSDEPYEAANVMNHLYPARDKINPKAIDAIKERNELDIALMQYAISVLHGEEEK